MTDEPGTSGDDIGASKVGASTGGQLAENHELASVQSDGEERLGLIFEDFNISRTELRRVSRIGESVTPHLPAIIEDFVKWLQKQPYFDQYFPDQQDVDRVRDLQTTYWQAFFNGKVDRKFISAHKELAEVYVKSDLPLEYYMSAVNFIFEAIYKVLPTSQSTDIGSEDLLAFTKLLHLDMTLAANTFSTAYSKREMSHARSALEMSTPVAHIWDKVLMLPLSGFLDSRRTLEITSKILQSISDSQSEIFILDISGVGVVDSAVANYLIRVTKATRLMGCESVISGLSPAIAQSIVNLGINVENIKTTTTVKDALQFAFDQLGYKLVS